MKTFIYKLRLGSDAFALAILLLMLACVTPSVHAATTCTTSGFPTPIASAVPSGGYNADAPLGTIVWKGPVWSGRVTCTTSNPFPNNLNVAIVGGVTNGHLIAPHLQAGALVNGVNYNWGSTDAGGGVVFLDPNVVWPAGATSVSFDLTVQLLLRIASGTVNLGNGNTDWQVCPRLYGDPAQGYPCSTASMVFAMYNAGGLNPVTPTCGFQTHNVDIPLGIIQASTLSAPGSSSPWVNGNLISTGCNAVTQLSMTFNAAADPNNSSLFQASGGATGVGIQLQTADGRAVTPNSGTPLTFAPQPAGGGYGFQARYTRTSAPLGNGEGDAKVTVNITYQ